jgi:FAD/FMN-containing dehydrogenase
MKLFFRKKQTLITSLVIALFVFVSAKVYQYASAPSRLKDCNFIYPKSADQTKPTTITISTSEHLLDFKQKGGVINDASCLNKTSVYGVVKISSIEDVRNTLQFSHENKLKVMSAGQQHSMGGQSFIQNGLVMDMKNFNQMKLDKKHKILNVQSGAIWADIQQFLDKEGLAVKAMQSINIFTVGGTLSVNAHGIAHDPGPIAPTVRSMRIMLSDGTIKTASLTQNVELFKSVLGGYGLFGVILDVNLEVVDNEMYEWTRDFMDYKDFPEYYKNNIENNGNIGLLYGRLSMSPTSYLTEMIIHKYKKIKFDGPTPPLQFPQHTWINRLAINFSKTGGFGRWIRWVLEKYAEPNLHLCSRNQAMSQKEVCIVSKNQEMYDAMGYLKNKLKDTDILQEYFIPHDKMPEFVDGLRETVKENGANLLNVTIRIVSKDEITSLPYAKENMFAFVLYFNQKFHETESKILQKTTTNLIDVATSVGGTYYLPYQLYYSPEQLHKAYPEIDTFFANKKKYDPTALFTNKFYEKYAK